MQLYRHRQKLTELQYASSKLEEAKAYAKLAVSSQEAAASINQQTYQQTYQQPQQQAAKPDPRAEAVGGEE
jgi:hypothetical protein